MDISEHQDAAGHGQLRALGADIRMAGTPLDGNEYGMEHRPELLGHKSENSIIVRGTENEKEKKPSTTWTALSRVVLCNLRIASQVYVMWQVPFGMSQPGFEIFDSPSCPFISRRISEVGRASVTDGLWVLASSTDPVARDGFDHLAARCIQSDLWAMVSKQFSAL